MTIASMTGFAATAQEFDFGTVALELRAVNHRYLDVQFRIPDELRIIESAIREQIAARLTRGKVDCRISFASRVTIATGSELNLAAVQELVKLDAQVRSHVPGVAALSVAEILRWPGVLATHDVPSETLRESALGLLAQALEEFQQTRLREGAKLKDSLLERVARMEELARGVAPLIPQIVKTYQEKLTAKLMEAAGSPDDERLRQEAILYAAKVDVDEELTRLQTHLGEVRRILSRGGAAGKRLDFLMQELNREANTLGSKSVSTESSNVSMELKVLIEQMREQIQNIE
jgi:uncharacterized protein (TIGR00255 family)